MFEKEHFLILHPFHWECKYCHQKSTFYGEGFSLKQKLDKTFEGQQNDHSIEEINIFRQFEDSVRTIKTLGNQSAAIICEDKYECVKCGLLSRIICWVDISKTKISDDEYKVQIEDIIILDGDLILQCIPGLYRGVDVAVGLNDLYLRWWYLSGDIYILCPFMDSDEFSYLDDVGRKIHKTHNNMFICRNNRNPFNKIISRDKLWDREKRSWIPIKERLRRYIVDNCTYEWDENLNANIIREGAEGSGLLHYFTENIQDVNIRSNVAQKDRDNFYYKGYFHGKIYGAILAENAEVVVTIYNYVNVETLQFESVALQRMDKAEFKYQIDKISKDNKLEFQPMENPLKDFETLWF